MTIRNRDAYDAQLRTLPASAERMMQLYRSLQCRFS